MASRVKQRREVLSESRMREICTSGSMSGDGKRGVAEWPKLPRPSSTLPKGRTAPAPPTGSKSTCPWRIRKLRCDRHLEQTAAMVPPCVVVKGGMGGRRLARSFSRSAAAERKDLRIRHGQVEVLRQTMSSLTSPLKSLVSETLPSGGTLPRSDRVGQISGSRSWNPAQS